MVAVVEGTDGLAGDVGRACRPLLLEKNWRHTTTQWSPHGALGEVVMCPELARVLRPGFPPPRGFLHLRLGWKHFKSDYRLYA